MANGTTPERSDSDTGELVTADQTEAEAGTLNPAGETIADPGVLAPEEDRRLAALGRYDILDTAPEPGFDRITTLATRIFSAPVSTISLVDRSRVWFKSRVGWQGDQVTRETSLCSWAVLQEEVLVIHDARLDRRLSCNPFVQMEPGIRFYAGAPLITADGFNLGTLCIIDTEPRDQFDEAQRQTLADLAAVVVDELELRRLLQQSARAAAALGAGEERLRLAAAAELGIFEWDVAADRAVWENDRMYEIYGYDQADVPLSKAQFLESVLHPDDKEEFERALSAGTEPGQLFRSVCRICRKDGEWRQVEFAGRFELAPDGTPVRLVGVLGDITDRLRSEQALLEHEQHARALAEEANRVKDEFLATLGHELRSPLNAILGWVQMLRGGRLNPAAQLNALEVVERNARAQNRLIEDLLDVSRIITGKLRLDIQPVELTAVITAALDTVRPAAEAKSIDLISVLDPQAAIVSGDPNRLQQVVWNLLSNAVKFTPKGGRVQIELSRAGSYVEIIVADSGAGIAPAVLPHIFERFRQADSSTTRTHGGLGLGLAIVRQLTESHGGSVRVDSPGLNQGTTFTVRLPVRTVRYSKAEAAGVYPGVTNALPDSVDLPQLDGVRVLVVDDEADSREMVKAVLEVSGAEVATAASAAAAVALLRRVPFDVLVSDIGMPEEDGYSLIQRVRLLGTGAAKVPAAALTAYARPEDRTRALLAGFQQYLSKPVEPGELTAVVASLARRIGESLSK